MNRKFGLSITLICTCLFELGPTSCSISLADDPKPALPAFGKAEPMPAMDGCFVPPMAGLAPTAPIPSLSPIRKLFGSLATPGSARFAMANAPTPPW